MGIAVALEEICPDSLSLPQQQLRANMNLRALSLAPALSLPTPAAWDSPLVSTGPHRDQHKLALDAPLWAA